jgi:tetratricopeptide (TPR) repeat protein
MIHKGLRRCLCFTVLSLAIYGICQSTPDAEQIQKHLSEAHRLLAENKPAAAIPEFQAVVGLDPANTDARANLGVLLFFQQKYAAAVPELREALRLKPGLWKIQALLGMGERRSGENAAARADLENAFPELQEKKIRIEAGLELLEIYSASNELEKASEIANTMLSVDPENQEVLYAAYRIRSDSAQQAILSLSLVAPRSALLYQAAAHEAALRGDTASAIADYRQALKLNPGLPGLHFELAEMLHTLPAASGAGDEAQSEYEAALAQNPFDEKADLRLADIALRNDDPKKAYDFAARGLDLQPDDPEANYVVGKILMNMNQPQKAVVPLEHAEQFDPTNAVIHFRLSTVYRRLGRDTDAVHEVEEYRKYKNLKEQLRHTWQELHVNPEKPDIDDSTPEK